MVRREYHNYRQCQLTVVIVQLYRNGFIYALGSRHGSQRRHRRQQRHALRAWQREGAAAGCRSACALLHVAAASGSAEVAEWLEAPYPWHDDLAAYMVQQTAFAGGWRRVWSAGTGRAQVAVQAAGGISRQMVKCMCTSIRISVSFCAVAASPSCCRFAGLAFERAPAFFADFLRVSYCRPGGVVGRPTVLTNHSVGSGMSLQHIVHPFMPLAILGYAAQHM